MRKSLRYGFGALALVLATTTVAGCSSAASSGPAPAGNATAAPAADSLKGKGQVDITLWHAMGGVNGETLQKLVKEFNQRNSGKIKVTVNYKGTYDSALAAYKNASSQQRPDLIQMYDVGTRYMIDSKTTIPMQSFIDTDHYDASDLQPGIAGYYTIDKKLYSMPFNTSLPLLYINKQAFEKAGLDPNKPPTTLDEIMADAKKIKATPGETVKYGFGATLYGWFVEEWDAVAGKTLCNADNGRSGRATKAELVTDTNLKLVRWWQQMVKQGLAEKLDSNTANGDSAFGSGTVAIGLESTGTLGNFTQAAAAAKNPFTVGTGYFPKVDSGDAGGPTIGGGSLWAVNTGNAAKEQAAWELAKFLVSEKSQVTWHTSTGYFPISRSALDDPADKQWVAKSPQFETAVQQLQQTKLTPATQGCSIGEMPDIRNDVQNALQAAILQGEDAKKALTDAQNTADQQIASYDAKLGD